MADNATIPTTRPGDRCRVINPGTGAQLGSDATTLDKVEGAMAWVLLRPSVRPGMEYDRACYPVDWIQPTGGVDRSEAIAALIDPILADAGFPDLEDQRAQLVAAAAWLLVLAGSDWTSGQLTEAALATVVDEAANTAAGWVEA